MIDFRYHLVSIIAVFFALAAGIVLGAGPLGERVDANLPEQLNSMREQNSQLQEQIRDLEAIQEYRDGFIDAITPDVVGGRLSDREVVLLAMPNADGDLVDNVGEMLGESGASVTANVQVNENWTHGEAEAALDVLATELVSTGSTLPEEGDGHDRGAALLAQALLVSPEQAATETSLEGGQTGGLDEGALGISRQVDQEVMVGLTEAEFISVDGEAERKADLAVVVSGPLTEEDAGLPVEPLVSVVRAVDEAGSGTVVAGPPLADEGELIPTIRGDDELTGQISTVDSADLLVGRIAVVFALVEQESGGAGQYGYSGSADGPMPPIPERPAPEQQGEPEGEAPETGEEGGTDSGDGGGNGGEGGTG